MNDYPMKPVATG